MADATIRAVITADDKASATLSKFGDHASRVGSTLAAVFAGASIISFGKESVKAFNESETALAQLDAVLKSTGGASGVTKDQVVKLSKEIQKTTSVSDESALAVENMALTFTNIGKESFPDFTKAAIDVATAMNHGVTPNTEQLVNTTKQLGKALQDPDGSIGALHRMGINTDILKEKIKDIHDPIEKQKAILKELSTEMGGSAAEHAKTLGGQMEQLKNQFNDTQEKIGEALMKSLKPFMDFLSSHPEVIPIATDVLLGLAAAFVLVKTSALIGDTLALARVAIEGVGTAAQVTQTIVAMPMVMGSIAVAGALADIALVYKAVQTVIGAIDAMNKASASAVASGNSNDEFIKRLQTLQKTGTPDQKARAKQTLQELAASGAFASGTNFAPGGMALVGEQGPELVNLPRGSQVIPNNQIAGNVSINVNVGVFAGSQMELRKLATKLQGAYQDARSMGTA